MRCMNHLTKVASIKLDIMFQMVKPKRNTALSVARVITLSMDFGYYINSLVCPPVMLQKLTFRNSVVVQRKDIRPTVRKISIQ